jgi:cell division protein FtsI (penicillin-binding protein 3)
VPGYAVAGKTGTAQKVDPATGRYSHRKIVASFVGAVPAEAPRLVILVMIDEPETLRGRIHYAPAFREIAGCPQVPGGTSRPRETCGWRAG